MNDDDHGSGIEVGPDRAKLRVSDEGTRTIAGAFKTLFSKRRAKAEIDMSAARRLAAKIEAGDGTFDAMDRFFFATIYRKELRKLENQAAVLARTAELVESGAGMLNRALSPSEMSSDDTSHSEDHTSDDWINRFLSYAEDVSDETVRETYARLAAGEVCFPGTFSLSTLVVLRNLDPKTIKAIESLRRVVLNEAFVLPYVNVHGVYKLLGLDYEALIHLGSIGILNLADSSFVPENIAGAPDEAEILYGTRRVRLRTTNVGISLSPIWLLTTAGRELLRIIPFVHHESFFGWMAAGLALRRPSADPRIFITRWSDDGQNWTPVTIQPG